MCKIQLSPLRGRIGGVWWGRRRGEEGAQSGKSREEEGSEETAGAGRRDGRWRRAALCSEARAEDPCRLQAGGLWADTRQARASSCHCSFQSRQHQAAWEPGSKAAGRWWGGEPQRGTVLMGPSRGSWLWSLCPQASCSGVPTPLSPTGPCRGRIPVMGKLGLQPLVTWLSLATALPCLEAPGPHPPTAGPVLGSLASLPRAGSLRAAGS